MKKKSWFGFRLIKFLSIIVFIFTICSFLVVKFSPKVQINTANSMMMYDLNNEVFFKGNESKEWVDLDEISQFLIDATIVTEDKNFYYLHGLDFLWIIKASYVNIKSGAAVQGASTITQQYAKNLFLDFSKTWKRKWDEMWYTLRIEANYSKKEILEGYLNTINYGHGKYCIENASKYYFNKSAKDLNLAEASMLTGIPKAPSNYSPLVNFDLAKDRQLTILNLMVKNNLISEEERDLAYSLDLNFVGNSNEEELTTLMYYHDAVIDEHESINSIPDS